MRLVSGALRGGAALTNGENHYKTFPIAGSGRIRIRYKATKAGSLKFFFVGPDFDPDKPDATHTTANGTQYSSGAPADVAVLADTEAKIDVDGWGEAWGRIDFVPSAADGVTSFCDISQLPL